MPKPTFTKIGISLELLFYSRSWHVTNFCINWREKP